MPPARAAPRQTKDYDLRTMYLACLFGGVGLGRGAVACLRDSVLPVSAGGVARSSLFRPSTAAIGARGGGASFAAPPRQLREI